MREHIKKIVGIICLLLTTQAVAATAPKVAFVGDWLTNSWSLSFPANWVNAQSMQAAIAQKPAIIHIMEGSVFATEDYDSTYQIEIPTFEAQLTQMIQQGQAAKIQLVLGMEPIGFSVNSDVMQQLNSVIASLGAKYNIPVVNYSGAFYGTAQGFGWLACSCGIGLYQPFVNYYSPNEPTNAGFAIMTMMAQTAFNTVGATIKSVYLQNVERANETTITDGPVSNVNTVPPGPILQFTVVASYSNGASQQTLFNTNFATGSNGTWTSSNPLVGYVTQDGEFWALNAGSTIVKFTLPNGVWNEWIMYVN